MGDLLTTGIGNFNVNLNQTKVFEFTDLKDEENHDTINDSDFEILLDRTEMRNKLLKKMNNEMDKSIQEKKQALLSSMVTNQNQNTGTSKENKKYINKLKKNK